MVIGKIVDQGEESTIHNKLSDPEYEAERTRALTKIQSNIQSWYRSGARIFEREAIEELMKQLRALEGEAGTVFIRGLDGREVEFAVETGSTIPAGPNHEYIMYLVIPFSRPFSGTRLVAYSLTDLGNLHLSTISPSNI